MYILKTVKRNRKNWDLSIELAKAEFKLRYEGSYLGVFWYLLNPLLTFILLFFVFATRLGQNIPNYPLYLLLGIIMFNYFHQVTYDATHLIKDNRHLIKSINFPLWTLVSSVVMKYIFPHIFEMVIFFILMLILGRSPWTIVFYPLIMIVFAIFIFGVAIIFTSISIYLVDFESIWGFVSRLLWLATPIFYSFSDQKQLLAFNLINPLYYFITIAREIVIYNQLPAWWLLLGALSWTLLVLMVGIFTFNKLKTKIAEMV